MEYLLAVTAGLCVTYFFLFSLFPALFSLPRTRVTQREILPLILIFALSILGHLVSFMIPDEIVSNRFLHVYGGGFLATFMCFLVVKNTRLPIAKLQFFLSTGLIVTALGVVNEIVEFFLQNLDLGIYAPSINDTWLDLLSNTGGILIALIFLTPFIGRKEK